ncbi:hypothetical protein [Lapillicoccus sp.]|uniref:hypothetical protein n=1 Tax=Lapillicoccus sp. TaxID=1909287 RepID=UPI0025D0AE99|nr:hypothetical protein [Lapillicoccus sp.]
MSEDIDVDEALHAAILRTLVRQGRTPLELLVRQMRKERRDARVDAEAVYQCVTGSSLLVGHPGGEVGTLLEVLEGHVLTQRVPGPTAGRKDLWCTTALQPFLAWCSVLPLPLLSGGELTAAEFGHSALIGPPGWLPSAEPGDLLALQIEGGELGITLVDRDADTKSETGPVGQQDLRRLLARHYDVFRIYSLHTWSLPRPGELIAALTHALLERPEILRQPGVPLDELLYDPLNQQDIDHHWRDANAWRTDETVSFCITGMPENLHGEIRRRADAYGMSEDQYVIAVLGHLAWRTPFAEDLGSLDSWVPEESVEAGGGEDAAGRVAQMRPL